MFINGLFVVDCKEFFFFLKGFCLVLILLLYFVFFDLLNCLFFIYLLVVVFKLLCLYVIVLLFCLVLERIEILELFNFGIFLWSLYFFFVLML